MVEHSGNCELLFAIYNYLIYQQINNYNLCLFSTIFEKITSNCCPKILGISLIEIMKCKHFKTRTKTINKKRIIYNCCTLLKKEVSFSCHQECDSKEYKQYNKLQPKKEYKYKPKKGKCSRYYNEVSVMPKSSLYSTTKIKGFEKHHIFGGVANRPKSEQYGLFVWLSEEQHKYLTDRPLENLKLKKIAQATFMHQYNKSIDEFIDIFGKSWL